MHLTPSLPLSVRRCEISGSIDLHFFVAAVRGVLSNDHVTAREHQTQALALRSAKDTRALNHTLYRLLVPHTATAGEPIPEQRERSVDRLRLLRSRVPPRLHPAMAQDPLRVPPVQQGAPQVLRSVSPFLHGTSPHLDSRTTATVPGCTVIGCSACFVGVVSGVGLYVRWGWLGDM